MTKTQKWLLVGVVFVAIFFRFYQIAVLPGGLFPDEAANGLDINLMQQGQLDPFYERGNGREALFFYMLWGSVEIFGKGPWQHHIVSALIGVLSVLGCFLVTRKLFSLNAIDEKTINRATYIALIASFFMATSTWHTVLSRTAFRANLIPLFTSFTIYFALKAYTAYSKKNHLFWSAITGATFALGFYTYIAYRIFVPIIAVALLWPLMVDWFKLKFQYSKTFFQPVLIAIISFVIFIAPLAYYFYTHPGSFVGRSGQVSIFNPELNQGNLVGTALEVTKQSFTAYFNEGDLNWRHNISGLPFLSPVISPFFAIGLISCLILAILYMFKPLSRSRAWANFILIGWFFGMLLPVVTTAEGIPHGLRSIGTIPAVFIITAWGLVLMFNIVKKMFETRAILVSNWKKSLVVNSFKVLTVAFFTAIFLQSYFSYFVFAANSPENYYAFRSDLTTVSQYLNDQYKLGKGNKTNTYLVLDKFSVQTVDYLTSLNASNPSDPINQPYTQVDPENSWELKNLKSGDILVFCQSSLFDIKKFREFHPNASLMSEARNKFNQTIMAVYKIE